MIDPFFASVLERRLKAITEEMGLTLLRTTRSPILSEARDFVTGLYDGGGRILAQTEYIPILAFALQPACRASRPSRPPSPSACARGGTGSSA